MKKPTSPVAKSETKSQIKKKPKLTWFDQPIDYSNIPVEDYLHHLKNHPASDEEKKQAIALLWNYLDGYVAKVFAEAEREEAKAVEKLMATRNKANRDRTT